MNCAPISMAPLILAGITFYVAIHHALLYRASSRLLTHLAFSFLCITIGCYDLFCSGLYSSLSPAEGAVWQRLQTMALAWTGVALLAFTSELIQRRSRKLDIALSVYLILQFAANLFNTRDLMWTQTPAVKQFFLFGRIPLVYNEVTAGPLVKLQGLIGLFIGGYVLCSLFRQTDPEARRRNQPVFLGMLGLIAGVLHDTAVSSGLYAAPYLIEYAFMLLILGMTVALGRAHQQTEVALEESESRYRTLFSSVPDLVYSLDPSLRITSINQAGLDLLGRSQEELLGTPFPSLAQPGDQQALITAIETAVRGHQETVERVTFRVLAKGKEVQLSMHASVKYRADGHVLQHQGIVRDITARHQFEESLRQSEQRYRSFVQDFHGVAHQIKNDGTQVFIHGAIEKITGYTDAEFLSGTVKWAQIIHAMDRELVLAGNRRVLSLSGQHERREYRIVRKQGDIRWIEETVRSVGEENAPPLHIQGTIQDITVRKETEDELLRLAAAVAAAGESIMITDTSGRIRYVNPFFEKMTGYSREECIDKTPGILHSGKQNEAFYTRLWKTLSAGKTWHGQFINRRKDGSQFLEEATISPVRNAAGKIVNYVAVKRDVTQQVALEQQLRHSQKMEALGRLAGGIAHDFTNMLVVIQGNAQMAKDKLPADSDARKHVEKILDSTNRVSSLTGELLGFAQQQPIMLKTMNLNRTLRGIEEILSRSVEPSVRIAVKPSENSLMVRIDPTLIEQAIMHLSINACEAMPEGGQLTIETGAAFLTAAESLQLPLSAMEAEQANRQFAVITVSDNGIGMTDDVKAHIFEPFYTTKNKKRSTGLGLSTVYGIVEQHEGYITIYSNPGKGTTFRIFLPLPGDPASATAETEPQKPEPIPRGTETILLVDDEPLPRSVLANGLTELGYVVLEASNGEEAMDILHQGTQPPALILSDFILPDMTGADLLQTVLKEKPSRPVAYASGYPRAHLILQGAIPEDSVLFGKPYSISAIAPGIRSLLNRA